MEKKKIIIGATAIVLGALIVGTGISKADLFFNHSAKKNINSTISQDEVKKIVTDYTGISDLVFEKIEIDSGKNMTYYEVDSYKDNMEYDFDINAVTGEILSSKIEKRKSYNQNNASESVQNATQATLQPSTSEQIQETTVKIEIQTQTQTQQVQTQTTQTQQTQPQVQQTQGSETLLSESQIKGIVAKALNTENLVYQKIELSRDDDYNMQYVYDIEVIANGSTEYDIDINAVTGEILKSEIDD